MAKAVDLFAARKSLGEICSVPDRIISVYSLEKHVWEGGNSADARQIRLPELQTIREFQIDPVRPFLNDILRNMAAPYKRERVDSPVGQGYWIQAEFGSGKSHLLCFLAALALGASDAWKLVEAKEKEAGRGRRESLYRFWKEGLEAKSSGGQKGIFVIVKTLVGVGGGTVGMTDKGRRLTDYILDAAGEQLRLETGKNLSLYPAELLADRFLSDDLDRYRSDLKRFLRDPRFFDDDEFEDVDDFIREIQQNKSPDYKRSCGNKLWRFYTEYLKVQPHLPAETEEILKHLVETILAEGYSGVLLVLDEVSLFMKNRDEDQRADDEKTLVVLANRLAKIQNLPIWTVCSAQQAIESKLGVRNIIADDRLKLVKLLEEDHDYYDIVLARVREITNPAAIGNYFLHYKRGFSWPNSIGEEEFRHFFPFHKPAIEVLRAVTYELTTARSAIHFMHQTLKHQMRVGGNELIRLWELFDEAVRYEEDPSGVHAGLAAIKTTRESDYRAYETAKAQIDGLTKGSLKVHRDKAIKTLQTLFLYHVARTRQQGLTPEDIANSVLIERDADANPDENNQHYETLAENLKKELRQIAESLDDDHRPRYRFEPVSTGIDPRREWQRARDDAESNEAMQREAWEHLLALDEWSVRTRQVTVDLANGVKSIFRRIATASNRSAASSMPEPLDLTWQGRHIAGLVAMRDLGRVAADGLPLPAIDSDQSDFDFAVFVGTRSVSDGVVDKLLAQRRDPRVLLWTPDELTTEERDRLLDFAAYRKLVADWQGKATEDAVAVIDWVRGSLQTDLGKIARIVDNSYARGRVDALNNLRLDFHVAGELENILTPLVERVLLAAYESREIKFEPPFVFRKEEAVKVINGIVRSGLIPRGAKPNQDVSAARNFGHGLMIMARGRVEKLEVAQNRFVDEIWSFVDEKLSDDGQTMKVDVLYKNFMGIANSWNGKNYGLSRRMIQIYLLCLVREGKVRLTLAPKSGLSLPSIDYASVASVDFSARVLDALADVQKVAKPENWEVLRPYAEKLLGKTIESTHDDAAIATIRGELRELFRVEREQSVRTESKAGALFGTLKAPDPYATEVHQVATLFATDVAGNDDVNLILYGLKRALDYQAYDSNATAQDEVDDLANRLKNYRDLQSFLAYESELRVACGYRDHGLPDLSDLREAREIRRVVAEKLARPAPFVDSEVMLKTELIGHAPPVAGETGTIEALIHAYATVYLSFHDTVFDRLARARTKILGLLAGEDFKALTIMERIAALQPAVSPALEAELKRLADGIFSCPAPSRASVEAALRQGPVHSCGLSFQDADQHLAAAEAAAERAQGALDDALSRKVDVFLNPTVRERLKQGQAEPVIAGILACTTPAELRTYLVKACCEDPSLVETVNRYLKLIVVRRVKIGDFQPSISTVELGQIASLAEEFRGFLEDRLREVADGVDTLPMLQLE